MSLEFDPSLILSSCPLQPEFERILALTNDLTAAFGFLRQKRVACRTCPLVTSSAVLAEGESPAPSYAACPFWSQFDAQVQAAIREVLHELGRL